MKRSKKTLALVLGLALALCALTGCTGNTPEPPKEPEPAARSSMEIYEAFLDGSEMLIPEYDVAGLLNGAEYNVSAAVKTIRNSVAAEWGGDFFFGGAYSAYFDAGADGEPELVLRLEYDLPGEYTEPYYQILFLKARDDALYLTADTWEYYRTGVEIGKNGFVQQGGGSSAMSSYFDYSYINELGHNVFLYSAEYSFGNAQAVIPDWYLPVDETPEEYSGYDDYYSENGFEIDRYNFLNSDDYSFDDDKQWQQYRQGFEYVMLDQSGKDAAVPEPFASLYAKLGITIMKNDDMLSRISEQCRSKGCAPEIISAEPVEWTLLDKDWTPKG
ncbi:MAG: hypothetical protein II488_01460 [Firmicutes bacterium]|nr:hypothetical protein [Bacillota bacterium]